MKLPKLNKILSNVENRSNRIYYPLRSSIARLKFWPFLFSHGLFHVCIALALAALCWYFYKQTVTLKPEYKQIKIELNDSYYRPIQHLTLDCGGSRNILKKKGVPQGISVIAAFEPTDSLFYNRREKCPYRQDSLLCRRSTITIDTYNSDFFFEDGKQGSTTERRENQTIHVDSLTDNHISVSSYAPDNELVLCTVWGYLLSSDIDNPYYHFFIDLKSRSYPSINENTHGRVCLMFSDNDSTGMARTTLHIINISPQKYTYDPHEGILFDVKDVIEQGGIYLFAEDIYKKTEAERDIFFYSVLLGAALAFLLDVLVNLVIKWRNLTRGAYSSGRFKYRGFRFRR